jgi:predicted amidohydrolase
MPVKLGDRSANQDMVRDWMRQYYVRSEILTAMALPELWDVGYALNEPRNFSDHRAEEAVEFLGKIAREYRCWFTAGSVMAEIDGKLYNRTLILNPDGDLIAHYDKVHLVPFITVEDGVFESGEKPCVFDMDGITVGSVICYDIRFPEWIRIYALRGAEVLFICSQWTRARMSLFETMIKAHAIENMFYCVAVNNCDLSGDIDFGGGSFVCTPSGDSVVSCSGTRDGKFAEVDVTDIDENRKFLKVIEKRRPALYEELIH